LTVAVPYRLIGMVHLRPLFGAPAFDGDFDTVIDAAVADARTLAEAGFDAVIVENFGDVPFFAEDVPKVTVAAMTTAVTAVASAGLPVGVNVLRNDALAALAVVAATPASFVRVNVLSGTMFTDQGPIVGAAADVARFRAAHCPDAAILADVFVKHATPPPGLSLHDATVDLSERSGADGVVVSGSATGAPADLDDLKTVTESTRLPVFAGSGVNPGSIAAVLSVADGAIIGSATKPGGKIEAKVDLGLASAVVAAAS
jgi:uncharacterized protein